MHANLLVDLATILVLAVGAQLVAVRLRIPSILLLLIVGFLASELGLIDPGAIPADILLPLVSLAVGLILFEGGLTLDFREMRADAPRVVVRLLTIGVVVTWLLGAFAAKLIFDLPWSLSFLLGAVLVVSGPTVVLPLLKHMRLSGRVESILRWEGIVVDPIGALLAVLVFQAVLAGQAPTPLESVGEFLLNTAVGSVVGVVAAAILVALIRRARLSDNQEIAATFALVVAAVAAANEMGDEAGLVAATLMGMVVANVHKHEVQHIHVFKESVGMVLTGVLFVVLAGRVGWESIKDVGLEALLLVLALVLVARPLTALVSTVGSRLDWRERAMIGWMAPRGIVAAATASIFAVELTEGENPIAGAEDLAPITFVVIVGTVVVYGLTGGPLARTLGLVRTGPPRILIAGAHGWGRSLAAELRRHDIPVKLWATRPENQELARQAKLEVRGGDLLRDNPLEREDVDIAILMTENSEFNGLAALHLREQLHPDNIYQLSAPTTGSVRARPAFDPGVNYGLMDAWFRAGGIIKSQAIDSDEQYAAGPDDVPLMVVTPGRSARVVTGRGKVGARKGQVVIALERAVATADEEQAGTSSESER
jgi:NhaP-type Na+/H+ or K+/H+ antiporter